MSDDSEMTADELTFRHHDHDGYTYSVLFTREPDGRVGVDMLKSHGAGPDAVDDQTDSYQGLSASDQQQLAEWLLAPAQQETR